MANEIGRAWRKGLAGGHATTAQLARVIYGTRRQPTQDASQATTTTSAIGIGPRSVWQGPPRAARPGEPSLRRAKP